MRDSVLILVPLLVLAVVFVLGFAGCKQVFGLDDPVLGSRTLTFRARVPTTLVVSPPGVRFVWTRPGSTTEEEEIVATFVQEGSDNVYEHKLPQAGEGLPEPGIWFARCEMTVKQGNKSASGASPAFEFTLPNSFEDFVLTFATSGGPTAPPFEVTPIGFGQE
jgi:hypothetical protein